ncbi:MAG: nucleoside deaminase [Chlamydiae bacterium]|nr:nucleoside deaminase [Chlamydiota bacterium]
MNEALLEAKKAFIVGEVPVGAVIVHSGKILVRSHNLVESLQDASKHAELACMQKAAEILQNWRLLGCTLYCTLEPCSMCAGAMLLFRIPRLVWGAPDVRHGANGSFVDLFSKTHPTHTIDITSGVLQDECSHIIKEFFQKRRMESNVRESL